MDKNFFAKALKVVIWACLAVIVFSPLYVSGTLFFPFITTKTFAFQIAVEIMFVAFSALCLADKKYRFHLNVAVGLMLLYLVILTIASAVSGNDFYHSFWSNNEREDGILMLGHLCLFAAVLTGFFRSVKDWLYLFDMFVIASFAVALTALDQFIYLSFPTVWVDHFMAASNGSRLAATIGNAGYVGGYMIFGIFIALFLALKRSNVWARAWYIAVIVLELFITIQTQTRGAYVALGLGGLVAAIYLMWFYFDKKYLKIALATLVAVGIIGLSGIFIFKNSAFVKGNDILNRVASISISEGTANNRLITWGIGWQAFLDKPLLGWGQENFYQAFDKYYTTKNSEQWFDRCHNMICDRAVTGGIFGVLAYLAFLLVPFWALWKYYTKEYQEQAEMKDNLARRFLTPIIFTILIGAYLIQNMFIFEALATYVPLIIVLCFVGMFSRDFKPEWLSGQQTKIGIFAVSAVCFLPSLYLFNLSPMQANQDFIKVLGNSSATVKTKIDAFEDVLDRNQTGNQEYRKHYFNYYQDVFAQYLSDSSLQTSENIQLLGNFSNVMEQEFNKQISENPHSVSNYLLLLRLYNVAYVFDISRLDKALANAETAIALSPGRPEVYYEVASSYYYSAHYAWESEESAKGEEYIRQAVGMFYRGAKLNNHPTEGFDDLAQFLIAISSQKHGADIAAALAGGDLGDGLKASDLTAALSQWLSQPYDEADAAKSDSRKTQLAQILNWLLAADSGNAELKAQLAALK